MSPQIRNYIIIGLLVISCLIFLVRLRKRLKRSRRKADRLPLNAYQRQIARRAQKLVATKNFLGAAQLLESIGRHRDAITILEKSGYIREACNLLLRMHLPERAGRIYARHGHWRDAADCFEKGKLPLEVARCAREYGDWNRAATNFLKAGQIEEAARCFEHGGQVREAARLLTENGHDELAIQLYRQLLNEVTDIRLLDFNERELATIRRYLAAGQLDARFGEALGGNNIMDVIVELIHKSMTKEAADLYLRSHSDIGPHLIALTSLSDDGNRCLGEMFMAASNYEYAGMVFERLQEFEKAGEAFIHCEDYERAAYCYERAGNHKKSQTLLARYAGSGAARIQRKKSQELFAKKNKDQNIPRFELTQSSEKSAFDLSDTANNAMTEPDEKTVIVDASQLAADSLDVSKLPPLEDNVTSESRLSFHKAKFIEDLDYQQKNQIWDAGEVQRFPAGSTILDFNDEPKGVYFILTGRVVCEKKDSKANASPDYMHPPATFGEFWLLVELPSNLKFIAESPCEILVVSRERFNDLLDKNGTIARKLYKRFTQRLMERFITPQNSKINKEAS